MTQIHGKFYTEGEFDIKKILKEKGEILELGRSCVSKEYRNKPIIKLLWKAISAYMEHYKIKTLFGCASFPGVNYKKYKQQLSLLHYYYLSPESIRPKALPPNNIKLNKREPLLIFLQRLRDEAHRFAVSSHRMKRKKNLTKSLLDQINGIGRTRKRALLNYFGSAKADESASLDDYKKVEGIETSVAKKIHDFFHD